MLEITEDFIVEDFGVQEMWVYDMEVDELHNFVANGILVHNSNYVCLDVLVEKQGLDETKVAEVVEFLDCYYKEKMDPVIKSIAQDVCDTVNGYEQRMFWEREVIAQSAIWQAKKMYTMAVNNSEGTAYEKPKIKITGLAAKKSDYPEWSRNHMSKVYEICLLGTESQLKEYVKQVRQEWYSLPVETIAAAKGVKNLEKWADRDSDKGWSNSHTPGHVRASYAHNQYLKENPTVGVSPIVSGDKILQIKLRDDNPWELNSFAFKSHLPPEWEVNEYIDKEAMLYAVFLKPIELILGKIGWSHDTRVSFTKSGDTDPVAKRLSGQTVHAKGRKLNAPVKSTGKKLW